MVTLTTRFAAAQSTSPAPRCDVASEHPALTVHVTAGTTSFDVRLDGAPAVVHLASRAGPSLVDVNGALVFTGTATPPAGRPRSTTHTRDDVVQLDEWAVLDDARADGEMLTARATIGPGVHIARVAVPCADVTLDEVPREHAPLREPTCGENTWQSRTRTIDFRASPDRAASTVVQLDGASDGLIVCEIERRGAWLRVANIDSVHVDAGQITGWVPVSALRRIRSTIGFTGGRSMPLPAPVAHASSTLFSHERDVYRGPAHLADAAAVSVAPNGAIWARIRGAFVRAEVEFRSGEAWGRVVSIDGIAPGFPAWIHRDGLTSPMDHPLAH